MVILPKIRDPRFITVRRGGVLEDDDHRLLAMWAAACAEHVLHYFEVARPNDNRPRRAVELGRAWARGEITWWEARGGWACKRSGPRIEWGGAPCRIRRRTGRG